ncbi:TRAP transporter substrate-binding protein [Neobacillus niacini]|uniref:TRAP transporter substrate-binding protein n=1 Tax=Neobacillus niacini TaxID=86668 RepID=UPI0007ABB09C|nr:TRAP transporter substrate-binding protein [Neobacillus niacini]MEC1524998.1 TRAP transporter substrate-binding protein [Neobacillus niacini]
MKKFSLVLCLLMVMIFGVACGNSTQSTSESKNVTNGSSSSGSNNEKYVLKLAHGYPTEAFHHTHMQWFAEEVKKRSDGRLTIEIYPSAQLMPVDQEAPSILQGVIDMSHSSSPTLASFDPIWNVYELPFIFKYDPKDPAVYLENREKFNHSENGGKLIAKKMEERGLKVLAYAYTGTFGALFTNDINKEITNPESVKGLKIRTPGGIITPETVKSLGASSMTISGAEIIPALQQNVVDGLLTSALYASDAKLPVKTFTVAPVFNPLTPVIISLKKFESLPKDLQDILVETGIDLEAHVKEVVTKGEIEAYQKLEKEMGVKFYYPTDKEIEEWKKATKPALELFEKQVDGGKELLEELSKSN